MGANSGWSDSEVQESFFIYFKQRTCKEEYLVIIAKIIANFIFRNSLVIQVTWHCVI